MFKCEQCGRMSEPREKQHKKVISRVPVLHSDTYLDVMGRKQTVQTQGTQIQKEISVCRKCATND